MIIVFQFPVVFLFLMIGVTLSIREPSIKQIIAFLIMLSGILGALLTFFLTLPPSETIFALTGILATIIAILAAFVKMLREMEKAVEKEVNVRTIDKGVA